MVEHKLEHKLESPMKGYCEMAYDAKVRIVNDHEEWEDRRWDYGSNHEEGVSLQLFMRII